MARRQIQSVVGRALDALALLVDLGGEQRQMRQVQARLEYQQGTASPALATR